MDHFQPVAKIGDIPPGEARCVHVGTSTVALFHASDGYHAIDDTCPHAGVSLSEGCLAGHIVTCPAHGWTYDVRTGLPPVGNHAAIAAYPVRVAGDEVLVGLTPLPVPPPEPDPYDYV